MLITLPSGLSLDVAFAPEEDRPKLAVCLHPWSWLGGTKDDPSVPFSVFFVDHSHITSSLLLSLVAQLHARDYNVLRYNSRGVVHSTGWSSLTGLREAQDLHELVQWALRKVSRVTSVVFIVRHLD